MFFPFAEGWVGVARDRLQPLWLQHSRGAQNYELVIPGFGFQLPWSTPYVISLRDFYRASPLPEWMHITLTSELAGSTPDTSAAKLKDWKFEMQKLVTIYIYSPALPNKQLIILPCYLCGYWRQETCSTHPGLAERQKLHFSFPSKP